MADEADQPNSEEVVFEAVVFCGGPSGNDENNAAPANGFREEYDLYDAPTPDQESEPMDFEPDDDDPDYVVPPNERNDDKSDENIKIKLTKTKRLPRKKRLMFNKKNSGVKATVANKLSCNKPYDFMQIFLDDKFLQKMVDATNKYAHMCKENNEVINRWIQPWRDTNVEEMRKFIGVIIWMGLVKYPTLNSYWCRNHLYTNSVMNSISRSQFQLLSHMWRIGPDCPRANDMISPLFNDLKKKFKQMVTAPELFTVEKMFLRTEAETEGINMLFLQIKGGYVYDFSVSQGKRQRDITADQALKLSESLLGKGRTLCCTEELTSVTLAQRLLERKTYVVGLLHQDNTDIPDELRQKRVFGNQTEAYTTDTGITFRKYNPCFDQYLLTTGKGALSDYYKFRSLTSVSNDLRITNPVLMNSLNWYQQLAVEVIINLCLINACFLYRKVCTRKTSSIRFIEDVVTGMLQFPNNLRPSSLTLGKLGLDEDFIGSDHSLVRLVKPKRCVGCYERICREHGRKEAMNRAAKSPYQCPVCNKSFCVECYFVYHAGRLRNVTYLPNSSI